MATVDARGLKCPMPLVMAKVAAETLAPGDELLILASDPEASVDLAAWATEEGYRLAETARAGFSEFALSRP